MVPGVPRKRCILWECVADERTNLAFSIDAWFGKDRNQEQPMNHYSWRRTDDGWETREGELTWEGWLPDWKIWRETAQTWWLKSATRKQASGPYVHPRQAAQQLSDLRTDAHDTVEMPVYRPATGGFSA